MVEKFESERIEDLGSLDVFPADDVIAENDVIRLHGDLQGNQFYSPTAVEALDDPERVIRISSSSRLLSDCVGHLLREEIASPNPEESPKTIFHVAIVDGRGTRPGLTFMQEVPPLQAKSIMKYPKGFLQKMQDASTV